MSVDNKFIIGFTVKCDTELFFTLAIDKMFAMPSGWYQTIPKPGRSPTMLVVAVLALQWIRIVWWCFLMFFSNFVVVEDIDRRLVIQQDPCIGNASTFLYGVGNTRFLGKDFIVFFRR